MTKKSKTLEAQEVYIYVYIYWIYIYLCAFVCVYHVCVYTNVYIYTLQVGATRGHGR